MFRLIQFLITYSYTIYFLILASISINLIFKSSNYHNVGLFTSYQEFSGSILSSVSKVKGYISLTKENKELLKENQKLRDMLTTSKRKTSQNVLLLKDTVYKQQYYYREAKVVDYSLNRDVNYIIIDKGRNQGIQKEMAVISAKGVVGIVKDVSNNFATIISMLNKDKLSFFGVLPSSGYSGRVNWNTGNIKTLNLFEVPKNSPVNIGDSVVTGRASSVFPEGIHIGSVLEINEVEGEPFYSIILNSAVNFSRLNNVYVIGNIFKDEQNQLKEEFIYNFK